MTNGSNLAQMGFQLNILSHNELIDRYTLLMYHIRTHVPEHLSHFLVSFDLEEAYWQNKKAMTERRPTWYSESPM